MKKLLTLTFLALPTFAFAGGAGTGVNLSDYNIVEPSSSVESSAAATSTEQATQPTRRATRTSYRTTQRDRSARRGYGFRLSRNTGTRGTKNRTSRTTRGTKIYTLNGVNYDTYWEWIRAYRAENNDDTGITRITTGTLNYGNAYDLANGLEPIDPKDNTYRGITREGERQSAAQLKMMRLRGLR